MESNNVQMSESPLTIKIFTLFVLFGFIGYLIGGIIEFINFSLLGIIYFTLSLYFCIIFIGLVTEKKWSVYLLFIYIIASIVYSIWSNVNQIMTKSGYISLGIGIIFLIIIIFILTREEVKTYFNQ